MTTNQKNLKLCDQPQNAQTPQPTLAQKPLQELGAILYIQKMCEKAFSVSKSNIHAYDYATMDKVLMSSFNLLMLCYKASSATSEQDKNEIRSKIKSELQLLCVIVLLAFGIDIFGLENKITKNIITYNQKANLYLQFLVQTFVLMQTTVFFKLQDINISSNFLAKTI